MRAIWSGAISFGLVNIPVKLYSASGDSNLNFDMLAKQDLSPIKYARIAKTDGREVAFKDIVKGYEIEKGKYVVLNDKDFEKASASKTKAIEILNFVNEDEIDPIYFDKPYYLEPDKSSSKPYALLREALKKSKKVGIATFVLRNREHIAAIKISNDVIILNQMRYHTDVRDPSELNLPKTKSVSNSELSMASKLIDQLTEKFDPEQFKDTYIDELKKIIKAKASGKTIEIDSKTPEPTKVKNLMDILKASLDSSKKKTTKDRPAAKRKASAKKVRKKN